MKRPHLAAREHGGGHRGRSRRAGRSGRALESDQPAADIVRVAIQEGTMPLAEAALRKVLEGITSLVEVQQIDRLPGLAVPDAVIEPVPVAPAPPPAPMMTGPRTNLSLVLRREERIVWQHPLHEGANRIGVRDALAGILPHADLTAHDRVGLIAPWHCQVIVDGNQLWVLDELGSSGTQLNGRALDRTQRTPAKPGDTVTLAGNLALVIEAEPRTAGPVSKNGTGAGFPSGAEHTAGFQLRR